MPSAGVPTLPPSPSIAKRLRRGVTSSADSAPRTQCGTITGSPRTFSSPSVRHLGENPVDRALEARRAAQPVAEGVHQTAKPDVCQTIAGSGAIDAVRDGAIGRGDRGLLGVESGGNDRDEEKDQAGNRAALGRVHAGRVIGNGSRRQCRGQTPVKGLFRRGYIAKERPYLARNDSSEDRMLKRTMGGVVAAVLALAPALQRKQRPRPRTRSSTAAVSASGSRSEGPGPSSQKRRGVRDLRSRTLGRAGGTRADRGTRRFRTQRPLSR